MKKLWNHWKQLSWKYKVIGLIALLAAAGIYDRLNPPAPCKCKQTPPITSPNVPAVREENRS
jgi:hypothetical protein